MSLPLLQASRASVVLNIGSTFGSIGYPGFTAYSASKFAMNGFFEALRTEVAAHGVSVTLAYPGVVDTQIRLRGFNAAGQPAGKSGLEIMQAMLRGEQYSTIFKDTRDLAKVTADDVNRVAAKYLRSTFINAGISSLQGAHHVAQ